MNLAILQQGMHHGFDQSGIDITDMRQIQLERTRRLKSRHPSLRISRFADLDDVSADGLDNI